MKKMATIAALILVPQLASAKEDSTTKIYNMLKTDTENFISFTKQNTVTVDADFAKAIGASKIEKVKTMDALSEPFDPETNMCNYDKKVINKIKDLTNKNNNKYEWLPNDLKAQKSAMPEDVILADKASINVTLFSIDSYDSSADTIAKRKVLKGSNQYAKLNPEAFSDSHASSFLFSLDCSGYLTASMSAGVGFSGAELKSAGQTALNSKKSAIVVRSLVYSPIAISVDPAKFPEEKTSMISKRDRLEIVYSIISELKAMPANAIIKFPKALDLLWTSNQGESSFQGTASVSASGSASFGFGNVNGTAQAGLDVSRRSKYSNFKTYIVTEEQGDKIDLKEIKALAKTLTENAFVVNKLEQNISGEYLISYDIPKYVCEETTWKVKIPAKGTFLDAGKVSIDFDKESGCKFVVDIEKKPEVLASKNFVINGKNEKWTGEVAYLIKLKK